MTALNEPLYKQRELVLHTPTSTIRAVLATMPDKHGSTLYLLAATPEGTAPTWATDREVTDP